MLPTIDLETQLRAIAAGELTDPAACRQALAAARIEGEKRERAWSDWTLLRSDADKAFFSATPAA